MEPNNVGGFLSKFGQGLGRTIMGIGSLGLSEVAFANAAEQQRRIDQAAQQKAQQQQDLAKIIASPMTPDQKLQALAQLGTADAVQYAQELAKPQELPASIREFQAIQAMPEEQRRAFQEMQNQITPFQREQLALERMKVENSAEFQQQQARQRAQALELQARQLEAAGRRQEAAAVRQEAAVIAEETAPPKMFNWGNVADPLRGIETQTRRDIAKTQLGNEAQTIINKQQEAISAASEEKQAMEAFQAAMERQGGSGGMSRFLPDIAASFDPELADMMQASAFMVPKMREPGSGATSDFDAKMFEKATIGREKPTETNMRIIQARKAAADNVIAKADFLEAFRADNGHLRGAEAQWRKYLNANPIFDPKSTKEPTLNQNRRDWREYFGGSGEQGSNAIPDGLKQIGTSGGKPVYQDAQGNAFIAE